MNGEKIVVKQISLDGMSFTKELEEILESCSPEFRSWIKALTRTRNGRRELKTCVRRIMQAGKETGVTSIAEAILYINDYLASAAGKTANLGDFLKVGGARALRSFKEEFRVKAGEGFTTMAFIYGMTSHSGISGIKEGTYPAKEKPEQEKRQVDFLEDLIPQKRRAPRQKDLYLNPSDNFRTLRYYAKLVGSDGSIDPKLLKRIGNIWEKFLPMGISFDEFREDEIWFRQETWKLVQALYPIFGDLIFKMPRRDDFEYYLWMLTLRSWASYVKDFKGSEYIWTERNILPAGSMLGFTHVGRVDILKLLSIDGQPVSPEQWTKVKKDVSFGERPNFWSLINYFTENFSEVGLTMSGEIIYFLPDHLPSSHIIQPNLDTLRKVFTETVSWKFDKGSETAIVREVTNTVMRIIRSLDNGKISSQKSDSGPKVFSLPFVEEDGGEERHDESFERLREFVDAHRTFLDPGTRITEQIGRTQKGEPKFVFDFARFVEMVKKGKIRSDSLRWLRSKHPMGGFIPCLNPNHHEKNPSLRIYMGTRFFICYGCRIRGEVKGIEKVYPDLPDLRVEREGVGGTIKRLSDIVLPDEHHQIMTTAGEILRHSLSRSPKGEEARRYLIEKRKLDLRLALAYGFGFGDGDFIFKMLARGFTFEQLVFYGFLPYRFCRRKLVSLFARHLLEYLGTDIENIARYEEEEGGEYTMLLPYSILEDRITAPLLLPGARHSNFYARILPSVSTDKKVIHRKLPINETGITTGAFNIDILSNPDYTEVIMTEGAMDALTLIQMGIPNVMAVVGVDNVITLDLMTVSGKAIAIALDNDEAGLEATKRVTERLDYAGHDMTMVRNYTADFITEHPSAADHDDYNTWWQKAGYDEFCQSKN